MKKFFRIIVLCAVGLLLVGAGAYGARRLYFQSKDLKVLDYAPYERLYQLKKTDPADSKKIDSIIRDSTYFRQNAEVQSTELVSDKEIGLVVNITQNRMHNIQQEEVRRQAIVLHALIPKLDYVEYRENGEVKWIYRQQGTMDNITTFFADSDQNLKRVVRYRNTFQTYMNRLNPQFAASTANDVVNNYLRENTKTDGGEFVAADHVVIFAQDDGDYTYLYTIARANNYRFINDNLVDISDGVAQPYVFVTQKTANNNYVFSHVERASDLKDFQSNVQTMFPSSAATDALERKEHVEELLQNRMNTQLKSYMEQLGRTGGYGDFYDFSYVYPDDLGVSAEVMQKVTGTSELLSYPLWIGTQEFVENGTRYVYRTSYSEGDSLIVFEKYAYDTPEEIVQSYRVSVNDGTLTEG